MNLGLSAGSMVCQILLRDTVGVPDILQDLYQTKLGMLSQRELSVLQNNLR